MDEGFTSEEAMEIVTKMPNFTQPKVG